MSAHESNATRIGNSLNVANGEKLRQGAAQAIPDFSGLPSWRDVIKLGKPPALPGD